MEDADRLRRARLVAVLDQADAALRDMAEVLGNYKADLIGAGFTDDEAVDLCIDVQRAVIFGHEAT